MVYRKAESIIALALILTLGGCAAPEMTASDLDPELIREEETRQRVLGLQREREYDARLQRVAWPVLVAAKSLCREDVVRRPGLKYENIFIYDEPFQTAAREAYGLDERLRITQVTAGGPAARAGVRVGDIVVGVNGTEVPADKKAVQNLTELIGATIEQSHFITFDLRRDGKPLSATVETVNACAYPVVLAMSEEINAYANGDLIIVNHGMVRFAEDDSVLATVIAHELAHNSQQHIRKKVRNGWWGLFFDALIAEAGGHTANTFQKLAMTAHSKDFEREADYVGMYALALSGYDLSLARDFWREMGASNPMRIAYGYTHPTTAERALEIDGTIDEIQAKIAAGLPLRPDFSR